MMTFVGYAKNRQNRNKFSSNKACLVQHRRHSSEHALTFGDDLQMVGLPHFGVAGNLESLLKADAIGLNWE